KFIKYFTFLSLEEIEAIQAEFEQAPETRIAQKALAKEVTTLVHGKEAYEQAIRISEALFIGNIKELSASDISLGFKGVPSYQVKEDDSLNLVDLLVASKIETSKRQAREDVQNGAIYINGESINEINYELQSSDKIEDTTTVVRRGKKKYFLLQF